MGVAKVFRVTVEVGDLDAAARLYADLLGTPGKRHPGARHYLDAGGVVVSLQAPQGKPTPGPKSLYFSVDDLDAIHGRAAAANVLASYDVHGAPAAQPTKRPWGERAFYFTDPWGNELCFVAAGTEYR